MASEFDFPYEGSDEASENELLDKSLSCWTGWSALKGIREDFAPVPVDLHTASSLGQYDAVRAYIMRGDVDLNRKNNGGWTPLMYASYIGHDNIVNLLLESGVSVHIENNKGQTPLMLASSCGNESVCYFLLQQGADMEAKDKKGWTTLFHATYAGHQNVVKFLLENGADREVREPVNGYTPLMWAAYEGHEIIVQYYLQFGADVHVRGQDGNTARCLAFISGFTKIVSLIDNNAMAGVSLRSEPGLGDEADFSSSDESFQNPRAHTRRQSSSKTKGPSISEGPEAFARLIGPANQASTPTDSQTTPVPTGYVSFEEGGGSEPPGGLCFRDFTSPINPEDHMDNCNRGQAAFPRRTSPHDSRDSAEADEEDNAFTQTGVSTIKSSSNSSGGLAAAFGLSRDSSAESLDEHFNRKEDPCENGTEHHRSKHKKSEATHKTNLHKGEKVKSPKNKNVTIDERINIHVEEKFEGCSNSKSSSSPKHENTASSKAHHELNDKARAEQLTILQNRPKELQEVIAELGMLKYLPIFEEQDVDLQVFLSLTDNDLKEVGIKLFGPRRKMTNAIARWHSKARPAARDLEQAYADKLESEMQEMAMRLHKAYEQMEQLKAQVLQEKELRSVTESYLMEHRMAWDQVFKVTADTQAHCQQMGTVINELRDHQDNLTKTLPNENNQPIKSSDLSSALTDQLSLADNVGGSSQASELTSGFKDQLSLGDNDGGRSQKSLLQQIDKCCDDLEREVTIALLNTNKLLGKNMELNVEATGHS